MIKGFVKEIPVRVKGYVRENLGAPFIIGFQVLLLVCAGLLIVGNTWLADGLATGAFFSLVIGVVLQLASFLKYRKKNEKSE